MKKIDLVALIPIALSVTYCSEKEQNKPNIVIIYDLVSEYPERAESLRTELKAIRESSSTAPRLLND